MRWLFALGLLFLTVSPLLAEEEDFVPDEGSPYRCDEKTGQCSCYGIVSCQNLRTSGECRGEVSCDADNTCTCASRKGPEKPPATTARPPEAPRPPAQ